MFLKVTPTRSGKIFLSFVQGYRDESGKSRQKTIKNIGWLNELKKQYSDPISHFREVAKQNKIEDITEYTIKNMDSKLIDENDNPKNLGYVVLKKVYNELGIASLLKQVQKNSKIEFDLNDILSLLVYMRILKPGSKKEAFAGQKHEKKENSL